MSFLSKLGYYNNAPKNEKKLVYACEKAMKKGENKPSSNEKVNKESKNDLTCFICKTVFKELGLLKLHMDGSHKYIKVKEREAENKEKKEEKKEAEKEGEKEEKKEEKKEVKKPCCVMCKNVFNDDSLLTKDNGKNYCKICLLYKNSLNKKLVYGGKNIQVTEKSENETSSSISIEEITCRACSKLFADNSSLELHLERSLVCQKRFSFEKNKDIIPKKEEKSENKIEESENEIFCVECNSEITCVACNKEFTDNDSLKLHLERNLVCKSLITLKKPIDNITPTKLTIVEMVNKLLDKATCNCCDEYPKCPHIYYCYSCISCKYCDRVLYKGRHSAWASMPLDEHYEESSYCNRMAYLEFEKEIKNFNIKNYIF